MTVSNVSRKLVSLTVGLLHGPDRDAGVRQITLQLADLDRGGMEHARGKRAIDPGDLEHVFEVLHRARAARRDQRHLGHGPHGGELHDVVALAHAVLVHAVEYDLAGAAALNLAYPVEGFALRL